MHINRKGVCALSRFCFVIIAICFSIGAAPLFTFAMADPPKVIRVGRFQFEEQLQNDDKGNFSGYGYDYLQEYNNMEDCVKGSQADPLLMSVRNKGLRSISATELNQALLLEMRQVQSGFLAAYVYRQPVKSILIVAAIFVVFSIALLVLLRKMYKNIYIDSLTGHYNYRALSREAPRLFGSHPERYALLYLDIHRFKVINDTFGYSVGDRVLKATSDALLNFIDHGERMARIHSDVFVLLLYYEGQAAFQLRLDTLAKSLKELVFTDSDKIKLLYKGGIYLLTKDFGDLEAAFDRAHYAEDSIAHIYSNTFVFYDDVIHIRVLQEKDLEDSMYSALAREEFVPYYQPKVNAVTEKVVGAEALVRWIHPEKGCIPPSEFIPFYEKNGFVVKIDLLIFEKVCRDLSRWIKSGTQMVPISVNFSRRNIQNKELPHKLKEIADQYMVPTNLLEIEVTETEELEDVKDAVAFVKDLKGYGFLISIDDYGTGYSSISFLQQLPMDTLKLDRRFTLNAMETDKARDIMQYLVSAMRKNGIHIICEGIETAVQREFVISLDCQFIQGFFYSMPLTKAGFEAYFLQHGTEQHEPLFEHAAEIDKDKLELALSLTGHAIFEYNFRTRRISLRNGFPKFGIENGTIFASLEDLIKNGKMHPEDVKKFPMTVEKLMLQTMPAIFEVRMRGESKESVYSWVRVTMSFVFDKNGQPIYSVGVLEDIDQQKRFEYAFRQEAQYREAFTESSLMAYEVNLTQDTIQRISGSRGFRLKNISLNLPDKNRYSAVMAASIPLLVAPEDQKKFSAEISNESLIALFQSGVFEKELEYRRIAWDNQVMWNLALVHLVMDHLSGDVLAYVYHRDISKRKATEQELVDQAAHDPLTGALNRVTAEQRIQALLSRPGKSGCVHAFLMLDLNRFKLINDTCGHLVGDKCLIHLTKILRENVQPDDIVARMGGDEFALLLADRMDESAVQTIADKIEKEVSTIGLEMEIDMPTSVSIGIALAPKHGMDFESLYHYADTAMYAEKSKSFF